MVKILLCLFLFGLVFGLTIEFLELMTEFLAAIFPLLFIVAIGFAICWLVILGVRRHKKQKNEIPSDLNKLIKKTNGASASTKQELQDFLSRNQLVRSFPTRVVGVIYNNDDGTSRQEVLSHCLRGEPVGFYWHTFQGAPACAVISDRGQVGYLSAELAADLDYEYGSDCYTMVGYISDITGGYDGYSYGCNLILSIYRTIE